MLIREEREEDRAAIRAVNLLAFDTPLEANLVDALRGAVEPLVSMVAVGEENVVGHILFSPVELPGHTELRLMGLGPMAVSPEYQNGGIGSKLVRAGLDRCLGLGFGAVVVLGHPEFYPRFGFRPGSFFGIFCSYDAPPEAFMAIELQPNYLESVEGTVRYHAAFDVV